MKLLENATVMQLEGTMDLFTGGVFTAQGEFIEDSILYRGKQPQLQKAIESLSDTCIYGGCLFGHFGHFIWESLSRVYAIRKCKEYPVVFISPNDKVYESQKIFLKGIGIRNEIRLVKVPTVVKNLIYASPGSAISPLFITDEQRNSLMSFVFTGTKNKRIWLSRSKLKAGRILNEEYIEMALRTLGYEIIHPEELPLREQVRLISTSAVVAGFDGSQFFSLLLANEIKGKFFIFNRRKEIPQTVPYVLEKRNIEYKVHTFDVEYVEGRGAASNFYHKDPGKIVDALRI